MVERGSQALIHVLKGRTGGWRSFLF
jgi:hypothetical protein